MGSTALSIFIIINTTGCFQTLFSFANRQNNFLTVILRDPIALRAHTKVRHAMFILGSHRGEYSPGKKKQSCDSSTIQSFSTFRHTIIIRHKKIAKTCCLVSVLSIVVCRPFASTTFLSFVGNYSIRYSRRFFGVIYIRESV